MIAISIFVNRASRHTANVNRHIRTAIPMRFTGLQALQSLDVRTLSGAGRRDV